MSNSDKLIKLMKSYQDEENYNYVLFIEILTKLKALEIIKELLNLKVISIVNNDTRLIVRFGDVQYSLLVPDKYVDSLKEVLL